MEGETKQRNCGRLIIKLAIVFLICLLSLLEPSVLAEEKGCDQNNAWWCRIRGGKCYWARYALGRAYDVRKASGNDNPFDCCDLTVQKTFSDPFCQALYKKYDETAWMTPFTGLDSDGSFIPPDRYDHFCNNKAKFPIANHENGIYRAAPASGSDQETWRSTELYTNRLRFEPIWIAQEGISFCIAGSHYRTSSFSLWEPLKGFLPLAEKSFDIGNHIDPENSNNMNVITLPTPEERKLLIPRNNSWDNFWRYNLPEHYYEYVWLGLLERYKREPIVMMPPGYKKRPAHPEWQPDKNCQNPYRVSVTVIEADDSYLHNYLHIKVHAEPKTQPSGKNCPTGKIKMLMLEVRDQEGLPVGQFTDDVPCDQDPETISKTLQCNNNDGKTQCRAHHGSKMNHVPCMFSHPKSNVHPSIFMMVAEKFATTSGGELGSNGEQGGEAGGGETEGGDAEGGETSQQDFCRYNGKPKRERKPENVKYKKNPDQYVTEVHATWRFAQMDEGWVSELHFATMIIEDETPIQYYTSRQTVWEAVQRGALSVERYDYGTEQDCSSGVCQSKTYCLKQTLDQCCFRYRFNPYYQTNTYLQLALISSCVNETYNTNRPYGYSARYQAIKPTFKTRGGWDYFRKHYIAPQSVNCHVEITYSPDEFYTLKEEPFSRLPIRKTLKDFLNDKYTLENKKKYKPRNYNFHNRFEYYWGLSRSVTRDHWKDQTYELPDWHSPGMSMHTDESVPASRRVKTHMYLATEPVDAVKKLFDSAYQDPIVLKNELDDKPSREYFGSRYITPAIRDPVNQDVKNLQETKEPDSHDHEFTMEEMATNPDSRCPCPFFPTTPPPEFATKTPVELEGRRTHAINMLIAWVILVPLAYFVARFYKETYSRVFFLQEFWWHTIHILALMTALLFTVGGIYALKVKRSLGDPYEIVWTDATAFHIYMGYTIIGLFLVHLLVGAFRFYDVELRIIQIGLHWLFGWLEYYCVAAVILSAAGIPSGLMNCVTFYIYCAFLGFQVVFTLGMEYHMRKVDEELDLNPPRAYLPPPMMRIFHRDAPHSKFRIIMLVVFVFCCLLFYVAMHVTMKLDGGEYSCYQPSLDAAESEEIGG